MSRFDTDITKRLRWDKRYTNGHVPLTMEDAAEEIERLRFRLEYMEAKYGKINWDEASHPTQAAPAPSLQKPQRT